MKCSWCQQEIISSPFVKKKWDGIEETELYHTHCFMVAHIGLLSNIPDSIPKNERDFYIAPRKRIK